MILTRKNIKSADLDSLIDGRIRSGEISDLLLIYPTNRKVRNLKKEIVSLMPQKSAAGLYVETLGTISSKLLGQSYKFNNLSEAAATVFIKQSAARQKLSYFSNYKNEIPPGTLDRIKNVISEYKKSGITPEILRREAGSLDKSEKLKALDIAAVYETYNSICHSLKSYETGDIYAFLNELDGAEFERNFFSLYKSVRVIALIGFDDFTGPEIEIISSLADLKNTELYINFDYSRNNKSLFGHLDNTYEKLASRGFVKVEDKSPSYRNEFNELIRDRLFGLQSSAPAVKFRDRLKIISSLDREQEVAAIAKEIKKLITSDGIQPHKICVVFNLIKNYSPAVRDLFAKHGIPFNLSDRQSLSISPPVTAIVNFLEIAENDYYYKNIFRALNGGFVELPDVDTPNLQKAAAELKIIVGKENWQSILSAAAEKSYYDNADGKNITESRRYLKALSDLKKIGSLLDVFEKKQTIPEFMQTLEEFVYRSGIPLKLIEGSNESEADIKAVTVFLETMKEIFILLEEELGGDKKFSLKFFLDQIRTACGWARYNVKEKSDYGVLVTTLEEIRGLRFDYIFLGGMCDGDLPTKYSPEIFFSGSFVKKAAIHQLEERYRFYQVLCSWQKGLILSWPVTQSGKETVLSTFLKDFEKLFETEKSDDTDYGGVYTSAEEMQLFFGRMESENPEYPSAEEIAGLLPDVEKIRTAIRVDKLRTGLPGSDSVYSGIILDDGEGNTGGSLSAAELKARFTEMKDRQYSVSQLETYAKCPFKFYMERILNIETVEEPTEEIEALEMGRVLHEIFFEFYTKMRKLKISVARCGNEVFEQAEKFLFEIADEVIEKSSFRSPVTFFEREKITGLAGNRRESILYRFLESERNAEDNFLPQFFEVSFGRIRKEGSDEILSDSEPAEFGGIKLRGKIDRIEIDAGSGSFNIVDYKLGGAKPGPSDFQNGISLQLPVYLRAAGNLLEKKFESGFMPANMFIYSLKYRESEFGKKKISTGRGKDADLIGDLIENTGAFIIQYVENISRGRFNLSMLPDREEKVCRFCGFKPVCRVDDVLS